MRRSPGVALVASPLSGVPPCFTVRRNADGRKASTCVLTPHEGKLCLSKIICRRPQSYGRRSCAFVRSCVEGPQALGEHASGRNLRSIVEPGPGAESLGKHASGGNLRSIVEACPRG